MLVQGERKGTLSTTIVTRESLQRTVTSPGERTERGDSSSFGKHPDAKAAKTEKDQGITFLDIVLGGSYLLGKGSFFLGKSLLWDLPRDFIVNPLATFFRNMPTPGIPKGNGGPPEVEVQDEQDAAQRAPTTTNTSTVAEDSSESGQPVLTTSGTGDTVQLDSDGEEIEPTYRNDPALQAYTDVDADLEEPHINLRDQIKLTKHTDDDVVYLAKAVLAGVWRQCAAELSDANETPDDHLTSKAVTDRLGRTQLMLKSGALCAALRNACQHYAELLEDEDMTPQERFQAVVDNTSKPNIVFKIYDLFEAPTATA